jgi:carbonic anhydrase/acetyltransferase-like protein (isoleucine patch superfamily)
MNKISRPVLGRDVYIAPTSYVSGDLTIGDETTIMPLAVVRGDIAPIRIGARVNVQDGAILHTLYDVPLEIGDDVGIGHRAVVHCRRVGPHALIGIGAIVLDDCEIGTDCIVGAGAVLPPRTFIPDGKVVMGLPGKIVRDVTQRDLETIDEVIESYRQIGRMHAAGGFPNIAAS